MSQNYRETQGSGGWRAGKGREMAPHQMNQEAIETWEEAIDKLDPKTTG